MLILILILIVVIVVYFANKQTEKQQAHYQELMKSYENISSKEVLDAKLIEVNKEREEIQQKEKQISRECAKYYYIPTLVYCCIAVLYFPISTFLTEYVQKIYLSILIIFPLTVLGGFVVIVPQIKQKKKLALTNRMNETYYEIRGIQEQKRKLTIEDLGRQFNVSPEQINYDLVDILKTHPELKNDWWLQQGSVEVISNVLEKKYKLTQHALAKTDLQLENLKLKNESIAIDNSQKKFWTCNYCGNYNPGSEMSCIKCGASRSV